MRFVSHWREFSSMQRVEPNLTVEPLPGAALAVRAATNLGGERDMPARTAGTATGGEQRVGRALDALNFFLADVRDGLGPYLAIYLLTVQKWDAASIGIVTSIAGI